MPTMEKRGIGGTDGHQRTKGCAGSCRGCQSKEVLAGKEALAAVEANGVGALAEKEAPAAAEVDRAEVPCEKKKLRQQW